MNDALNNARDVINELISHNYHVNINDDDILITYYVDDNSCRRTYIILKNAIMIFVMKCADNIQYVSIESIHKSICECKS